MKKLIICLALILTVLLTGCNQTTQIPVGVIPTEKFTIIEYVADSAVYQAESNLEISGTAQTGVVMVASLYDSKNDLVQQVYTDTNKEGVWKLSLTTPSGSNKNYKLKIADSNNTFFEVFDEIKFGEVWTVLGDKLDVYTEEENNFNTDYNKMVYVDSKWLDISKSNNQFVNELLIKMSKKNKNDIPVGVILVESEDSHIYQWLSKDAINSRNYVKSFLIENKLYVENNANITENDMTYYDLRYLSKISGMSTKNIIWNQGLADTKYINNTTGDVFNNVYFQMLYTFITSLEYNFNVINNIYILQAESKNIQNIDKLRDIQSKISSYFGKCDLIPTYDLNYLEKSLDNDYEVIVKAIEITSLMDRIINYDTLHIKTPCLENFVAIYNEENVVVKYVLNFENVSSFDKTSQITGLIFYDENGDEIELSYDIEGNKIIIDLSDAKEEDTVSYVVLSKITYGISEIIYDNDLKTEEIPVIPFKIILNRRG